MPLLKVHRTKITLKTENRESSKKRRSSYIASKFQSTGEDGQMKALATIGSDTILEIVVEPNNI